MPWSSHINEKLAKAEKRLSMMRRSKHILPRSCLDQLYKSMILPLLDYCDIIYDSCTMYKSEQLDKLQRKASLSCTGAFRINSDEKLLKQLGCNLPHNSNNYQFRRNNSFIVPLIHRESFSKSYFPKTIRIWNKLPNDEKQFTIAEYF